MKIQHGMLRTSGMALFSACLFGSCDAVKDKEVRAGIHFDEPPNILMIALDDMNDWVGAWGGPAITPNIDRLASEGRMFRNSYCIVPLSNGSRVNLMTGQRPETTFQFTNQGNFRDRPGGQERITIPQYLRTFDYKAVAAGKLFHLPRGMEEEPNPFSDDISWDYQWIGPMGTPGNELFIDENENALWLEGIDMEILEDIAPYLRRTGVWGPIPHSKEECGDWQIADFGAQYLQKDHDQPFFLALGIYRPHAPHIAPQEYFDLYPIDQIQMPEVPEDEMDDIPEFNKANWTTPFVDLVMQQGQWENAVQGYLASTSFADDCVGHIMDALDQSQYRDNTIVIFYSDHGFHMAEKDRWEKYSLWHRATRSPAIIRLPEGMIEPGVTNTPVSLLDIFPTVTDLLGHSMPDFVEGNSLLPLLIDPEAEWEYPAVVTFEPGNHSVLFENWNYIRYKDGSEELYDYNTDPGEFNNLSANPEYRELMDSFAKWLPETPDGEDWYWFETHYSDRAPGHRR